MLQSHIYVIFIWACPSPQPPQAAVWGFGSGCSGLRFARCFAQPSAPLPSLTLTNIWYFGTQPLSIAMQRWHRPKHTVYYSLKLFFFCCSNIYHIKLWEMMPMKCKSVTETYHIYCYMSLQEKKLFSQKWVKNVQKKLFFFSKSRKTALRNGE